MIIDENTKRLICDQLDTYIITGEYRIADEALENLEGVLSEEKYLFFDKILDQKLGRRRIKYGFKPNKEIKNDSQRRSKIEKEVIAPQIINL